MSQVHQLFETPRTVAKVESRFEELWKIWPRREGKVLARTKYLAIVNGGLKTRTLEKDSGQFISIELESTEEHILAAAKAYISSQIDTNTYKMKDGGKYIPHLGTWLNKGRFEDFEE